jgi:hypothetical protein
MTTMENTYDLVSITVRNNDDAFLGSDPEAIAKIDVEKSVANYQVELKAALVAAFPGADITLEHFNYSGRSIIIDIDYEDVHEFSTIEISEDVTAIVERIYNRGTFWIEK